VRPRASWWCAAVGPGWGTWSGLSKYLAEQVAQKLLNRYVSGSHSGFTNVVMDGPIRCSGCGRSQPRALCEASNDQLEVANYH
jgi:hypothetical protein